jgi:hypothetical protein
LGPGSCFGFADDGWKARGGVPRAEEMEQCTWRGVDGWQVYTPLQGDPIPMTKARITILLGVAVLLLAACWCGCSSPPRIRGTGELSAWYETIWVEPRIVRSDSLFTLIRADRIDSVRIDDAGAGIVPGAASVRIDIAGAACPVVVTVRDGQGYVVWRLLDEEMPTGHYKLSLNLGLIGETTLPAGNYYLRADFCGRSVVEEFVRAG